MADFYSGASWFQHLAKQAAGPSWSKDITTFERLMGEGIGEGITRASKRADKSFRAYESSEFSAKGRKVWLEDIGVSAGVAAMTGMTIGNIFGYNKGESIEMGGYIGQIVLNEYGHASAATMFKDEDRIKKGMIKGMKSFHESWETGINNFSREMGNDKSEDVDIGFSRAEGKKMADRLMKEMQSIASERLTDLSD